MAYRIEQRQRMMRRIKRGEIYYADLGVTVGSEQRGIRPVLIIQNDIGNKYSPTTIVVPITSRIGKKSHQGTHVQIQCEGLLTCSVALTERIRTLDKRRFRRKVGSLNQDQIDKVDAALHISIGLK